MKKTLPFLIGCALIVSLAGCKTPNLEPGGAYAKTNAVGQVSKETALFVADSSHKFAYEAIQAVFKFERDNRAELWALNPKIKKEMDRSRVEVVRLDKRWAEARRSYRLNPTPEGLDTLNQIVFEFQRIIPIIQAQLNQPKT